jgi:hypothetical protein
VARGKKSRREKGGAAPAGPSTRTAPAAKGRAGAAAGDARPPAGKREGDGRRRLAAPPALAPLLLAAAAVVALGAWLRFTAPAPWSYDEYYHLGLAREMRHDLRMESFWWTPFSTLYDRFVDSTPLFHLLLMPLATLPLELGAGLGVLGGQLFVVAAFAWALWSLRAPRPWWFLLALPAMGTLSLQRLEMLRPHVWLIGFTVIVIALLVARRWTAVLVAGALFGLTHTGGWIAIPIAALWSLSGLVAREGDPPQSARVPWQPVAAAAGGWLLGQLVHPQVPANFELFLISNFVIPFQATSKGGDAALQSQLGTELLPPELWIVGEQWPAYVVAALMAGALLFQPQLRSRATFTAALPALAFMAAGTFLIRRFLELGEPLTLLALAVVAAEGARRRLAPPPGWARKALAVATAVALLATVSSLRRQGYGRHAAPLAMARWLGEHGGKGERVFTAQWADSSPLFYAAPQLQSLVALDPTVFHAKDPQLFERFVKVVQGREPDPARTIREQFGARWVTLWRMPAYQDLALQLWRSPGTRVAYNDQDYLVLDLGKR